MRSVVAENQFEHFLTSDQHSVLGVITMVMMMVMVMMTLMMVMMMMTRGRRVVCGLGVGRVEA